MTYFHEEQRFGGWVYGILVIAIVSVVAALAMGIDRPGAIPALASAIGVVALIGALLGLSRLDVDVDASAIHIAFHMLWPARVIPLETVRSAQATRYSPLAWGGYGVHYMFLRGWSYNTGGTEGVLVETVDGARVMIGSQRPQELEAAVARAIADRRR